MLYVFVCSDSVLHPHDDTRVSQSVHYTIYTISAVEASSLPVEAASSSSHSSDGPGEERSSSSFPDSVSTNRTPVATKAMARSLLSV